MSESHCCLCRLLGIVPPPLASSYLPLLPKLRCVPWLTVGMLGYKKEVYFHHVLVDYLLCSGVGSEEDSFSGHILVYDLGGRTLDVTLLYSVQGFIRTVCSRTFHGLGGAVLDAALVNLLKEEYRRCADSSTFKGILF